MVHFLRFGFKSHFFSTKSQFQTHPKKNWAHKGNARTIKHWIYFGALQYIYIKSLLHVCKKRCCLKLHLFQQIKIHTRTNNQANAQ
jgi:hypothetical protein